MKRVLIVTVFALILSLISFSIIKLWGQSQVYPEYQHPLFTNQTTPIEFVKPSFETMKATLDGNENLYLDVTSTEDQKLVIPMRIRTAQEKGLRHQTYEEVKNEVLLLSDYKDKLQKRKMIFNITENAQAGHEIFFHNISELGLEKGENFVVTSPYEAVVKALKEMQPALVYGSTTPEILKILAMESMHLVEAAVIRADVIIHPLQIRNRPFYTDSLVKDFTRRHKKIIVGPITEAEKEKAVSLSPYGYIILK
jgi:hypothetical protein